MSDIDEERLKKALLKKAVGHTAKEEVIEFSIGENGEEIISKKKVTKKQLAPDVAALKLLIEKFYADKISLIENMSDEELVSERSRLLRLLKEEENAD